ncbi:MAG: bifunctional precorrin-2 dehydrogenase/sirohydrochlorin ferrochelatase [Bacteroidota bacterium]
MSNQLFPVFLKLDKLHTLVVGGGNVGLEKLEALLKNDPNAKVTLIAPFIRDEIREMAGDSSTIRLIERKYESSDLHRVDVAILATDDPELHKEIRTEARGQNILLNVADTPDLCDFYLGSTVKRGDLKIGISTNGKSPTFAKRFRQVLEDALPEETNHLLQNLKKIRDRLAGDFSFKIKELNHITKSLIE